MLNSEDEDERECSDFFSRTTGIPCVHKLEEVMADGRMVEQSDVHEQWSLKDIVEVELSKHSKYDMQWNELYEDYKKWQPHTQAAVVEQVRKVLMGENENILKDPVINAT
ncbi:hypothetical protein PsorP6_001911 [Peronosclerospora sorghi]|uniref:Uncharacterized protein n=1 Tax=Peronosclerospora sorghi TaxID=230839 RepID=A0ACC0WPT1_9STRA|nr:hypothetical protein PsorP6_001911 [Peronosclerospora sorghi]